MGWTHNLDVTTRPKVDGLADWQIEYQLLDEGGDVVVGANCAQPLFHPEHVLGHPDAHVLCNSDLAGQPFTRCGFTL